jgi:hypothetical protein
MQSRKQWPSVAALILAVLAVGLPYWRLPYASVSLPSSLDGRALLLLGVLALVLVGLGASGFRRALAVTAGAVPAAIMLRVILETTRNPSDHNLWPLELVIGAVTGLVYAVPGAIVGLLVRRARSREAAS